jgi:hypothetical protein
MAVAASSRPGGPVEISRREFSPALIRIAESRCIEPTSVVLRVQGQRSPRSGVNTGRGRLRRGGTCTCLILICVGDPRKGWDPCCLGCFGLVSPVLGAVEPQSGSRWSARSAARTNDLEAGAGPPHTCWPGDEAKTRVVQVICCLPEDAVDVHVARAGAQPYLGPRTRVRRHDD